MARILVVDDHDSVRTALRRILEADGHRVEEADDGREAMHILDEGRSDLVIADVYMPVMDGIEFLIRLVDRHPSIPVIAMSGGAYAPAGFVLRDARRLGAAATLEKPLVMDQVIGEVRRVIADKEASP